MNIFFKLNTTPPPKRATRYIHARACRENSIFSDYRYCLRPRKSRKSFLPFVFPFKPPRVIFIIESTAREEKQIWPRVSFENKENSCQHSRQDLIICI